MRAIWASVVGLLAAGSLVGCEALVGFGDLPGRDAGADARKAVDARHPSDAPADTTADTPGSCGRLTEPCCADDACDAPLTCREATCQLASGNTATGKPCTQSSDCASGICEPVGQPVGLRAGWTGSVCSTTCTSAGECVPGWTCGTGSGASTEVCLCSYSAEVCDGRDNDCDGVVDNEPATDEQCAATKGTNYVCRSGVCTCPVGYSASSGACCPTGRTGCNGACVDEENDPSNCGGCGVACLTGDTCTDRTCQCTPDGTCNSDCEDSCGNPCTGGSCSPTCVCGDGVCDSSCGETCDTCEADCGVCPPTCVCGDGTCDSSCETCDSCPEDCGPCDVPDACVPTGTCTNCDDGCGNGCDSGDCGG